MEAVATAPADAAPASPLRQVFGDPVLRRLNYALVGSVAGRFLFVIALGVYAYREGGAGLVGIAGFLRVAPGALMAPLAGPLVDRYSKVLVMAVSDLGRAACCWPRWPSPSTPGPFPSWPSRRWAPR